MTRHWLGEKFKCEIIKSSYEQTEETGIPIGIGLTERTGNKHLDDLVSLVSP